MSGSPVLAVKRGLIQARNGEQQLGQASKFLGVYSGRIADDPAGASLGYVWKPRVIDEIIAGNVQGEGRW